MNAAHLNEHDANQGAQSSGEFLGMTGNSGWYLLGSGGAAIMMVILLWGILGVSLLFCLFLGIVLCLLSIAYVFTLKNNKPEHYDADFFESALVEAGMLQLRFGPRVRRPMNPFTGAGAEGASVPSAEKRVPLHQSSTRQNRGAPSSPANRAAEPTADTATENPKVTRNKDEPTVPQAAYEQLREKLNVTEEMLEEVLAETAED